MHFKVGDRVWLSTEHLLVPDEDGELAKRGKFSSRWLGPYRVEEVLSRGRAYRLQLPPQQKFHPVQPVSRLEPVLDPQRHPEVRQEDPAIEIVREDGTTEYEVERILGKRVVRGRLKYLVQWKGYPEHEQTYESLEHLENAMDAVRDFEKYAAQFQAQVLMSMRGCRLAIGR